MMIFCVTADKCSDAESGSLYQGIAIDLFCMLACSTRWKAKQPTYVEHSPGTKRAIVARSYGLHAASTRANLALSGY